MSRPSPLQNRSAPDGTLFAVPERGLLMGNRGGRLHRNDGTLGRARWRGRAWIACRLDFRGRHREVMGAGYTEIFFLDEAIALAAGHRPCFECRRAEALAFAEAWGRATGEGTPRAPEMDARLHPERLGSPEAVPPSRLPAGAIYRHDGGFYLRTAAGAQGWSFAGYAPSEPLPAVPAVEAITPATIRSVLAAGYRPHLHPSAEPGPD